MKPSGLSPNPPTRKIQSVALMCCFALCSNASVLAQTPAASPAAPSAQSQVMTSTSPATTAASPAPEAPPIPADQLDSLVAPIALYSDPLLAQTLAASTYPLEIIQLQQWLDRNKGLKDKALVDAVAKQPWDPSVQTLAGTPDLLTRLAGNIQWTTDLGNAYLAQPNDVMDAVQRMRAKAQGTGNLKTSSEQVVQTKTVEGGKQVIVVEPAKQDVVYVPSYDPAVVYGPPAYPYYPYYYPGYYAGMGLAFGAGLWLGAAWGGAGADCDWGHGGDININNNNNFNRNNNINRGNRNQVNPLGGNRGQNGNRWQHNPSHRGNAPYGDRRTNDKFGQGNRGQGNRVRETAARALATGLRSFPLVAAARPVIGPVEVPAQEIVPSTRPSGGANRPSGGNRGSAGARPSTRPSGGTASNRVGNRSASSRSYSNRGGGFGGGSSSYARSSSSRGGRSMGGGGFSGGSRGEAAAAVAGVDVEAAEDVVDEPIR